MRALVVMMIGAFLLISSVVVFAHEGKETVEKVSSQTMSEGFADTAATMVAVSPESIDLDLSAIQKAVSDSATATVIKALALALTFGGMAFVYLRGQKNEGGTQ